MFDWEDLRYFAVFAREKSLSAAARVLNVDHATVARRISALEASLKLKLVDRRPRSYALTIDGQRIAGLGMRMEDGSFAVERAAKAGQRQLTGEVTISAPPAMSSALIAPQLGKFRQLHPHLYIQLIGETRLVSLSRRDADLAVRLSRPTDADLVVRKIGTSPFALYASPAYLAAHESSSFVFIAYDRSMERSQQQTWLKAKAGARVIVFRSNDLETQWAAARAGVGIAALPHFLGNRDDGLRIVKMPGKGLELDVWLAVHQDLRGAPAIRAVMDFLAGCFPAREKLQPTISK
jgi:DNA-binding transcriptional LysR family regulator